ncbi:MAG: LytTR family DNA-binding domain-containing protein [Terrimicrobiaceae bacterium]
MNSILIIEDEDYAREDLQDTILSILPDIEVCTTSTATEGLDLILERSFDAIFLDLELPGMSGLELLQKLPQTSPPVVLCTAHALSALDAFGMGVIECLLKPVDTERLRRVLERINGGYQRQSSPHNVPGSSSTGSDALQIDGYVLIRDAQQVWMVKVGEILRIERDGDNSRIFFPHGSGMVRRDLKYLEKRLDPRVFFRINESDIVNLRAVDHISATSAGQFVAHFAEGLELAFTLERSRALEREHGI